MNVPQISSAQISAQDCSPKFRIIQAPNRISTPQTDAEKESRPISIFLSGSIDTDPPWQETFANQHLRRLPLTVLNPYRPDWQSLGEEDISSPGFRDQVEWELDMLEMADLVVVRFGTETVAPISLLEFGLVARGNGKVSVVCPAGYKKRGNVQVVCKRFGIPLYEDLESLVGTIERRVKEIEAMQKPD